MIYIRDDGYKYSSHEIEFIDGGDAPFEIVKAILEHAPNAAEIPRVIATSATVTWLDGRQCTALSDWIWDARWVRRWIFTGPNEIPQGFKDELVRGWKEKGWIP